MTYTYVSVVGIRGIVSSDDSGKSSKMVNHLLTSISPAVTVINACLERRLFGSSEWLLIQSTQLLVHFP